MGHPRRIFAPTFRQAVPAALWAMIWLALSPSVFAQPTFRDQFEGPLPSWKIVGGDVRYQALDHQRVQSPVHSGAWSETFRIAGTGGSHVYAAYNMGRANVIQELKLSVWLRSDHGGLQIAARVVLPRAIDPKTGRALTTMIYGSLYQEVGRWQQLTIDKIPQRVARQTRIVRSDFPGRVDEREAYIDTLLVNVYGGNGTTNAWIDDLEISGFTGQRPDMQDTMPAARIERLPAIESAPIHVPKISLKGSILVAGGQPVFPRIIEYRGEPLEELRSLGFNTIQLTEVATPHQRAEAARLGLWLICPPPPTRGMAIDASFHSVLAWDLGSQLTHRSLATTAAEVRQLRSDDPVRRPIVGRPQTELRQYSRQFDALIAGREPIGTSLDLAQYAEWLRRRALLARTGTPMWNVVQTEASPAWLEQVITMSEHGDVNGAIDYRSMRHLAYTALVSGARGLLFTSRHPLTADDAATRQRRRSMMLINHELQVIETWLASGRFATPAESSDPSMTAAVIQTERARLLLPLRIAHHAQYAPVAATRRAVTFTVPGVPVSTRAYALSPTGLQPLTHRRVAGGMSITWSDPESVGMIVLTQDPRVVDRLAQQVARLRSKAVQGLRDVASDQLVVVTDVQRQLAELSESPPEAARRLREMRDLLGQCDQAITAKDDRRALKYARQTLDRATALQRTWWSRAVADLNAPEQQPLLACFATTADAYRWNRRNEDATLSENRLPGGEMENLDSMFAAGWRHSLLDGSRVVTDVELSTQVPHGGQRSLHLHVGADATNGSPAWIEAVPVWVRSSPVPVHRGQRLQIHAWVRVDRPIRGSVDGLVIFDSIGGIDLAQRITVTEGWQEVTLERAVGASGNLTVTIGLSGIGDAWIDDVTVRTFDPTVSQP